MLSHIGEIWALLKGPIAEKSNQNFERVNEINRFIRGVIFDHMEIMPVELLDYEFKH